MNDVIQYLYDIDKWFNDLFIVTEEELEESKNNNWVRFKVFFKQNRRVIALICIVILLIIDLDLLNYSSDAKTDLKSNSGEKLMHGGGYLNRAKLRGQQSLSSAAKASASSAAKKAGAKLKAAPAKMKAYADKKADQFKAISGDIYQLLFTLALAVMVGMVFGSMIIIALIFIFCNSTLKSKMSYLKSL